MKWQSNSFTFLVFLSYQLNPKAVAQFKKLFKRNRHREVQSVSYQPSTAHPDINELKSLQTACPRTAFFYTDSETGPRR